MTDPAQTARLASDRRALAGAATGVATYARALAAAQAAIDPAAALVTDDGGGDGGRGGRWARRLKAMWPSPRALAAVRGDGRHLLHRADLFRLAQVHFDIWRRPLRLVAPGRPGLVHWSYPVPIRIEGWRNLYTVHDAIPLTHPGLSPIDPRRHRRLLAAIAAGADRIVTVSGHARREIAAAMDWPIGRIVDCGQAVAAGRPGAVPPTGLTAGLGLGLAQDGYLLVCGSVERRKNVARIVAAYRASRLDLPLVIAGPEGWGAADAVAEIVGTPGVVRLPFLSGDAMQALIAGARAVLMLSLAEGFGLPVIEAMAQGTAVLASRGGALEETAGGAALLADAEDVADIAGAMRRIADDAGLRARLTAAGLERAAGFAPQHFAARLGALYAAVIASPPAAP